MRREFVANVTHELKTPLTSIRGYVELLQDEKRDAQTRAKFYEIIGIEADRLQRLIDDLLELSRIENNLQKAPETQCTDVSEIAQEALEHLSPMAQERQIAFSSELTPELTIRADQIGSFSSLQTSSKMPSNIIARAEALPSPRRLRAAWRSLRWRIQPRHPTGKPAAYLRAVLSRG